MALFNVETSHNDSFYLGITTGILLPKSRFPGHARGFETKEPREYSREFPREYSHRRTGIFPVAPYFIGFKVELPKPEKPTAQSDKRIARSSVR